MRGTADEGFGKVADVFARNFAEFSELGAAVTVFAGGRKVVELCDGLADERTGRAWTEHTVVPVFSCAKAIVSLCVHLLAQDGQLDLDAPIARYWPEFARHGKETITARLVLGHRAGLPVLDASPTFAEIAAWDPVVAAIEEQRPLWEPGTAYEYHGHVFGFVLGELVRRRTGLTPGAYFRRVVGEPLKLRAWLGLPAAELPALARLTEAEGRPPMPGPEHLLTRIVTMNGALAFPGLDSPHGWNDPELLAIELPGAGAVASATGLAGLFAAAVTGIDGSPRLLTPDTVTDAVRELSSGPGWLGFDSGARWGSGFLLDSAFRPLPGPRSFGNDGAGGQFAFADDESGIGFAYVANRMIGHGDERANRLVRALRDCLG
ncbi:CubicO group peptidase (beta-lactamase class C family) [Amycolatopsis bartoniae]|uniref:Esterase n=1 Tax=Amycolatopsis bartoniae TaxID=941986 RepID=A0A8H9M3N4_9PSEU|nr:serine hydrolase domain-containing protein [Amycolatopsis bartoniae]MBB2937715.1 CubicO group peptidase (beta-lactamase class C family) [Amycolatopsis bartoniae]TVT08201.1 beta-lactamase family protein [Amycolatopsis bartoniae]GHF40143.1 esterase [Amycolatopsis bartoniae]